MRWKQTILPLSLVLNLGFAGLALAVVHKKGGLPWLQKKFTEVISSESSAKRGGGYRSGRLSVFEQLSIGTNDLVFLGDSIFDYGEWHELMGDPRAKNRSINGDDTTTVLKRLDQIVAGKPAHVVVLLGINNFQKGISLTQTTTEYGSIVERLLSECDTTQIWLLPAFPVHPALYRRWIIPDHPAIHMPEQAEVESLNRFIRDLAAKNHTRVHFVPVPTVLDPSGHLAEDFTLDGLHLSGGGLVEIAKHLKKLL